MASSQSHHDFDIYFPLPYRIAFQIIIGVWGWGANVQALSAAHVDMAYLLRYQKHGNELYRAIYSYAKTLTVVYALSISVYWMVLSISPALEPGFQNPLQLGDLISWITVIVLVVSILYPRVISNFHSDGRGRFSKILHRILLGRLDSEYRLCDVLTADVLTSYGKTLVDLSITVCSLLHRNTCIGMPDRQCGGHYMVPLVSAIPFLIRFRQCMGEYLQTSQKIHLFNALKYFSAFPVIIFSALQRRFASDPANDDSILSDTTLWNLWVLSVIVNSTYSFIWDITFDWDLALLRSKEALRVGGLRPVLYFSSKHLYYIAILIDYLLRFSWSIKMSSHWYEVTDREGGLFVLSLLEVFRRWVWIFFRVESEWVKSIRSLNYAMDETESGSGNIKGT